MTHNKTPVYKALYKPFLILGVPPKLIALETAVGGILLFVIRNYLLCLIIALVHIIVAIICHKEKQAKILLSFWLRMSFEEKKS